MPFLPSDISIFIYWLVINLFLIIIGYLIVKRKLIWIAWIVFISTVFCIPQLCNKEQPVFKMLAIISSMFICMKIIAAAESYKTSKFNLSILQWIAFTVGWAGMRPQIFASLGKKPVEGAIRLILYGISRLCLGVLLFLAAKQMQHLHLHPQILFVCLTILLLVSYSLILHFGILSISAGVWRLLGVKTYLLFKSPLQSTSLSEFWSKRWNIAFSEMISIAIYRPLKNNVGPAGIVILSFIFSGLLHESAISLPVEQGFGLPLLYFAIQAAAILLENIFKKKNLSFLNNIVLARLWVYTWVILPAPLLFHIYFIKGVVLPLAGLG